ncbi:MAG TPA: hypothetical protein VLH75_16870 [Longimicrobiales bacterium]|nr:hypothetical protein [Longimicrobiales bacterium]
MRIAGAFPGGPTRTGSGRGAGGGPLLPTAEQLEAARLGHATRHAGARRRTRRATAVAFAGAAAALLGGLVGWASHTTREDLMAVQRPDDSLDGIISREVNRTLLELWKMEDVEALGQGMRR